jgi:hypothetical protein
MSTVPFTPLDESTRDQLLNAGFIHITGLESTDALGGNPNTITAHESHLGKWNTNNGMFVIVTEDGQVWLANYHPDAARQDALARKLCPNGKGAYVPCSNQEIIHISALLRRISDPYESDEMTTTRVFGGDRVII